MEACKTFASATLSYPCTIPECKWVTENITTTNVLSERLQALSHSRISNLCIGANLENGSGHWLAVGLADDKWAVLYGDDAFTYTYYSIGDPNAEGDVELYFQQWEVLAKRHFVDAEKAIQAIETWFESGELSHSISWERLSLI